MTLPTKPQTRAGMPPRRARVLLGAAAKVGKTETIANWAPATTLIVDTQNGTLLLNGEHYVKHVHDWPGFVGVVNDVCRGNHMFHTIGLDLVNDLWDACNLYYGKPADGIPASAIEDYGRSGARAKAAFKSQIGRLLAAPVGIWFLTHLREKTDKTGELVMYVPDLDKTIYAYIAGAVDFLWLAETEPKGRRVVHTQPTKHFESGSRVYLPSPLPLNAGEIARAMDRALNPSDYDENGERKQPESAPDVVPPTQEVTAETAPAERVETVKPTGQSDIPVDDVWWAKVQRQIKECTTGPELRSFLIDDLKVTVPEKVASWKTLLGGLPADKQAGLSIWLNEREAAKVGVPWAPPTERFVPIAPDIEGAPDGAEDASQLALEDAKP